MRARSRLIPGGIAAVVTVIAAPSIAGYSNRLMLGFDAGALVYLALAWTMMLTTTPESARLRAASEDPGRHFGFFMIVASSILVIVGGVTWMGAPGAQTIVTRTLIVATIVAAALAWTLTHTAFALHYAHMYYSCEADDLPADCSTGLQFPGTPDPDDLDFAYFAFTVGMCFQVSDVQITSRTFRRTVLWHALVSFGYNTAIVALVLNLVFAALHS
jgi:uncharacterized membrane protein